MAERFQVRLRRYRKARGLTQEQLAAKVGCSRVQITAMEVGTSETTLTKLAQLARILRVTPNDLLGWTDEADPLPDYDVAYEHGRRRERQALNARIRKVLENSESGMKGSR